MSCSAEVREVLSSPKNSRRTLVSAIKLALMLATVNLASNAAAETLDQERPATSAPRPAEPVTLSDVKVTARKRDERQIDVPIAMNAVSGEQIEALGLLDVKDTINITPGASALNTGGGFTQVQIRGVSSSLGGNDNGYYIDETPFTGVTVPWYPDVRSFDIERVEILKGPQGTLFGEGSMGGTVRIITRKPDVERFAAGIELDTSTVKGGSSGRGAKVFANVPLVENMLAIRVAATDEKVPGFITNSVTGEEHYNKDHIKTKRMKIRFTPVDNWTIDAAYWKYESGGKASSNSAYDDFSNDSFLALDHDWFSKSLTSVYDFSTSQVVYSFSDAELNYLNKGDLAPGIPISIDTNIGIRTHELRWASTGEHAVDWTVGYYKRESERKDTVLSPALRNSAGGQNNDAYALFGEATLHFAKRWALSAGLRYFDDKVDAKDASDSGDSTELNERFKSWNPRFNLSYKPADDTTIYISAAKGFRSGQIQPISSLILAKNAGIALPETLAPDKIWTYELGAKSIVADGKVMLEGAAFYSKWDGVTVRVPITPQINGLLNSDGTRSKGIEGNIVYTPSSSVNLQLGASWIDATYVSEVPNTPLFKGTPVYNVPRFGINTSGSYSWDVGSTLRATATVLAQHNSARETALTAGTPGDAITKVGARVSLESPQGWGITAYGDNLTNERGAVEARGASVFNDDGSLRSLGTASRLQPRTFGLLFRYEY